MGINLSCILDNIAAPVIAVTPVKDDSGKIIDFYIIYKNEELNKTAGFIIQNKSKWSEFSENITSNIPWFKMALDSIAGRYYDDVKYFSPSTQAWYKIEMNYIASEKYIIITFINITSEREYYKKLKQTLVTDTMTGFNNRAGFSDIFAITLQNARFKGYYAALLIIDIDNLQSINDSMGSAAGDKLIINVAKVLKQFQRDYIKIFRYGDDEFALIISNFESNDSLANFIDCIYDAFQMKQIFVSGGISMFPTNTEQKDEMIRFADMAVHYAKKNGKNTFVYFEPEMQRVFIQHLTLQAKMNTALIESNFTQYYQPQFDIQTGKLRGFEALIRWNDNELGNIEPSVFIPLAEETGLIVPIGRWVLQTAITTLKTWQTKYNFSGIISVNVSPIQLLSGNFTQELFDLINEYKISPALLEIEITEGVLINRMGDAIEKLRQIKAMGIRVSLDDFGTGYSSLSYLQMLPLNTLKIDKVFINDITSSNGVQATITRSIIDMVEKMGLETIAEGVENPEQLELLNKFNCNFVQGFLRGKPMPYNNCDAYLAGDTNAIWKNQD
ncbi:MAG: bifunctional diguanylate cyclase/phosphodiesterase [Treponema sp.]|nr:bifunctional diguanylate cyclase/phosphodiesterase [Treponema sp.]